MITEAIIRVFLLPFQWVLGIIPVINWPSWFQSSGSESVVAKAGEWGENIGVIDGWFPVNTFFDAMGIFVVCAGAALAIRLSRVLVSLFTGGGGSI